jgi:maltose O-acetyltransferase
MGEQRDLMLGGDLYDASDPELVEARRRCASIVGRINQQGNAEPDARDGLIRQLFAGIGAESTVMAPFFCDYGSQVSIGDRTFINAGATFLDSAIVTIGDDVQIGPSVQLLTAMHPVDAAERAKGLELALPISIGSGVWLGGGVIVLPGVKIGARTVVGAGAVVVGDLPSDVVAVGNPARVIRKL